MNEMNKRAWIRGKHSVMLRGGHPDPAIRGMGPGLKKCFFRPFGSQLGQKIRGGGRGPSPGSATTIGFYV